jgi:hypothetical protein
MVHFLPPDSYRDRYKGYLKFTSVAVQVISKPGNCQGTGFTLLLAAGIRVHVVAGYVMGAEHCKNHDIQMYSIVPVKAVVYISSKNV